MSKEWPIPVMILLVVFEGRVLLLRHPKRGWTFPNTFLQYRLSFKEATKLALSKVWLHVADLKSLDVAEQFVAGASGEDDYHYLFLYFTAHPIGGSFHLAEDVEDARWFSPDETISLGLSRYHRRLIREAVHKANFSPQDVGEAA